MLTIRIYSFKVLKVSSLKKNFQFNHDIYTNFAKCIRNFSFITVTEDRAEKSNLPKKKYILWYISLIHIPNITSVGILFACNETRISNSVRITNFFIEFA